MKILDCTIRDGGYINNWNFNKLQVCELYKTLIKANIDIIEVGFMDNISIYNNKYVSCWRKCNNKIIKDTFKDIYNKNLKISVMINYGTFDINNFIEKDKSLIDIIRIAFHKKNLKDIFEYAKILKNLGYIICVNAMGTINYNKEDLLFLCKSIIEYKIDYLYIADSYGSITTLELQELICNIKNNFIKINDKYKYKLGFHAHNNTQRALMNAIKCVELNIDIIDTTMYGMGRGAGNLCTELFLSELSKKNIKYSNDNIKYCIKYIYNYLLLNDNNFTIKWGYDLIFFITGHFNIHPNYGSKIKEYKIQDIELIWNIIELINKNNKGSNFDLEYFNSIINI